MRSGVEGGSHRVWSKNMKSGVRKRKPVGKPSWRREQLMELPDHQAKHGLMRDDL